MIEVSAADDVIVLGVGEVFGDEFGEIGDGLVGTINRGVRNYEIGAIGELARERFPGFAAHDDRVTRGGFLEETHIILQMEKELAFVADGVILVESGDDDVHLVLSIQ